MSAEVVSGEVVSRPEIPLQIITPDDVRESIRRAKVGLERAAEEIVWQIEREAWVTLGYPSWDAMREAEYGGAAFMVPRKDRPELVERMRAAGLTQQEVAATAGVTERTVRRDEDRTNVRSTDPEWKGSNDPFGDDPQSITSARKAKRRLPLPDAFHDATYDMSRLATRLENLHKDDRFSANKDALRRHKVDLFRAQTIIRKIIQDLP